MEMARLEILVEPFRENDPGPHVLAVLDVLQAANLTVEMGPFSTTVEGGVAELITASRDLLLAGMEAGASSIQTRLERL